MEHFAANKTIFAAEFNIEITAEDGDYKPFARSVTIVAAACAIMFSIIGVLGNILYPLESSFRPTYSNSIDLNFRPQPLRHGYLNSRQSSDGNCVIKIHQIETTCHHGVCDMPQYLRLDLLGG